MRKVKKIARWCVTIGAKKTSKSFWEVCYDDILKRFHVSDDWMVKHHNKIRELIDRQPEVWTKTESKVDEYHIPNGFYVYLDVPNPIIVANCKKIA